MAKADKRVQIVERDGEFFAEPGAIELEANQTMKIVNRTHEDLTWVVTDATLFGAVVVEEVKKKKLSTGQKVQTTAAAGVYDYEVVMKNGKRAKGHSDPVIIIDG